MKLTEKNHTALSGCESRAVFSPCEKYRYWLSRRWQEGGRSLAIGDSPYFSNSGIICRSLPFSVPGGPQPQMI